MTKQRDGEMAHHSKRRKRAVNKVLDDNNGLIEEVNLRGSVFLGSLLPKGKIELGNRRRTMLGRRLIDELALNGRRSNYRYKGGSSRGTEGHTSRQLRVIHRAIPFTIPPAP